MQALVGPVLIICVVQWVGLPGEAGQQARQRQERAGTKQQQLGGSGATAQQET